MDSSFGHVTATLLYLEPNTLNLNHPNFYELDGVYVMATRSSKQLRERESTLEVTIEDFDGTPSVQLKLAHKVACGQILARVDIMTS